MKELEYPFDSAYLIKKKKSIKRRLLESDISFLNKKIAVLGGSTTHDICVMLDLFLLNQGIKADFYESEYAKYWEDVMFDNADLIDFKPDIIFIHTTNKNIDHYPSLSDTEEDINNKLAADFGHYEQMWQKISSTYHCPVIQNNFDYPDYRLLGNKDATDYHGSVSYINRLNEMFARYARDNANFFIQDINYLSARYGLDSWYSPQHWHMYKYALNPEAIPTLAHNTANIIKSIYGKNKKSLVLDLDNTLWGGIVGDDGPENLEIGQETPTAQVFSEFQTYIKKHKDIGVILNICSKNEEENALAGLNRPDSILKPEDFIIIKANWDPKSINIEDTAKDLNLLPESFVFVDDNPAERDIVSAQLGISSPDIDIPENYIRILDRSGFFEVTNLSSDDAKRTKMYKENAERTKLERSFSNYGDYLSSLNMIGTIKPFEAMYYDRISQLTNKSNQFNLTTKRYTRAEIENTAVSDKYISLYGKLEDKFGDNGVVSVIIGSIDSVGSASNNNTVSNSILNIDLWIMSCRVLKRDMEYAMMDELVKQASEKNVSKLIGYYYPTAKNKMVKDFYSLMGFTKISEDEEGNSTWEYVISNNYTNQNKWIKVN